MATTTTAPVAKDGKDKPGKDGEAAKTPKGKKKLVLVLVVLLLVAGAAYKLVLAPKPAADAEPEPGAVLKLDPITLNLTEGHYLKMTLALQFTVEGSAAGGHGGGAELDGSKALDIAIDQLSNRRMAELNTAKARNVAKEKLQKAIVEAYHHDVMAIYLTEFVMQ
jgi:flagellar FliL protein